jgi:hypothetical protein
MFLLGLMLGYHVGLAFMWLVTSERMDDAYRLGWEDHAEIIRTMQ